MLTQADLTEVLRIVTTARLLETGKWEEEVQRLLGAAKVLAEQQAITRTLTEAKQVEAKAVKRLADVEVKAKALQDKVDQERVALRVKEEQLINSQADFARLSEEKNRKLAELDAELGRRQKAVVENETALNVRTTAAARREVTLETRETRLHESEKAFAANSDLGYKQKALLADEVALNARVAAVARKESAVGVRETALHEGEKALTDKIAKIKAAAL